MIEHLQGIHETVNYKSNTNIRLYDNSVEEDYPAHWHTPLEIIMPIVNDYTIHVGNRVHKLNVSDIIFICPGVIHELKSPSSGRRLIFQAELTVLRELNKLDPILNLMSPTLIITSTNAPQLHAILQSKLFDIYDEYNSNNLLSELIIYSKLLEMLVCVGRAESLHSERNDITTKMQKEYIERFMEICTYITAHCTEDLSLDNVAQLAGFSKYHFTRLFKQYTNTTFYKYLTQKRIAYAEQLLIAPDLSITEIALQSGFSNQSAFIRMFKLVKGSTPTKFRDIYSS